MQYAERLPNTRTMMVPVLALAIGAAAATGASALLDSTEDKLVVSDPKVIVTEVPSAPGEGVAAKDEAASAAAIGNSSSSSAFEGKDEAASAAAVGNSSTAGDSDSGSKTDPRGPASQLP